MTGGSTSRYAPVDTKRFRILLLMSLRIHHGKDRWRQRFEVGLGLGRRDLVVADLQGSPAIPAGDLTQATVETWGHILVDGPADAVLVLAQQVHELVHNRAVPDGV